MSNVAKMALKGVTYYDRIKTDDGYTVFGTKESLGDWTDAVVINMEGYIVNHWRLETTMVAHGRLLPNGHFIYPGLVEHIPEYYGGSRIGRVGGEFVELSWDGEIIRRIPAPYCTHDFYPFDACAYDAWPKNGRIIYVRYHPDDALSVEETKKWKGGIAGDEWEGRLVPCSLVEVDQNGKTIWEWVASDHFDPEIDWWPAYYTRTHWHSNGVGLCPDGNLVLTDRCMSRAYKIEYPSGKILMRYGENQISGPHDPEPLPNGNILVFDNGHYRHNYWAPYSRSVEFDGNSGEIVWQYIDDPPDAFYSGSQGGNQRLPNGNTLICETVNGRAFEVTPDCEIVWEYINPIMSRRIGDPTNHVFRFHRYPKDYPAFEGKDLDPKRFPWENETWGPEAWKSEFHPCIF